MGFCLAEQLLAPTHHLLCISRSISNELAAKAQRLGYDLQQLTSDLSEPQKAAQQLRQWLAAKLPDRVSSVTLINNAGTIPPIVPLTASDPADLSRALRIGLEAPLVLTSAFLASTQHWQASRRVLNISSGLGRRPMASQAAYCAAKAGMDHFTRCLALDEATVAQRGQSLLAGTRCHRHRNAAANAQRQPGKVPRPSAFCTTENRRATHQHTCRSRTGFGFFEPR